MPGAEYISEKLCRASSNFYRGFMKLNKYHFALLLTTISANTSASILWQGNFETGNMRQWHSTINPQGIALTNECVFDGRYAGKIEISGDESFLWHGNTALNRSEFQHRPTVGATYEGKETFFAFSFYLPKELSNKKHELGYWESDETWQQMLRFTIRGRELSFQETAEKNVFWSLADGATPGEWHRIALHIHWSTDARKGSAEIWFDGKHMGKNHFKTLPAKNALMFTHLGLLRAQEDSTATILIDGAMETDNLTELLEHDRHLVGKVCSPANH